MFKIGIKAYTCQVLSPGYLSDLLRYIEEGKCHYIELYLNPGTIDLALQKTDFLRNLSEIVVHAPTRTDGMNLGLPGQERENGEMLKETIRLADSLNAKYIIVHPGKNHELGETARQLKPFVDSRVLIENIPPDKKDILAFGGTLPEDISYFLEELKCGFVFDLPHAITAANAFELNPIAVLGAFSLLKPKMFHFYDGNFDSTQDDHLDIGYGDYPLEKLIRHISSDGMVTLETTQSTMIRLNNCSTNIEVMQHLFSKVYGKVHY